MHFFILREWARKFHSHSSLSQFENLSPIKYFLMKYIILSKTKLTCCCCSFGCCFCCCCWFASTCGGEADAARMRSFCSFKRFNSSSFSCSRWSASSRSVTRRKKRKGTGYYLSWNFQEKKLCFPYKKVKIDNVLWTEALSTRFWRYQLF